MRNYYFKDILRQLWDGILKCIMFKLCIFIVYIFMHLFMQGGGYLRAAQVRYSSIYGIQFRCIQSLNSRT